MLVLRYFYKPCTVSIVNSSLYLFSRAYGPSQQAVSGLQAVTLPLIDTLCKSSVRGLLRVFRAEKTFDLSKYSVPFVCLA